MRQIEKTIGVMMRRFGFSLRIRVYIKDLVVFLIYCMKNFGKVYVRVNDELNLAKNTWEYYFNSGEERQKKVMKLINNLDEDSVKNVELFIERCGHIYSNNIISKKIFTNEEILLQKNNHDKYGSVFSDMPYNESCFRFHNGLVFLSNDEKSYIENKDCLDLGAYNGDSSAIFSKNYKFSKIYAFEPENSNFDILKDNISRYSLLNVEPIKMAAADYSGKSVISNRGDASSLDTDNNEGDIVVTRVDDFVSENKLNVGVIKMDIEGLESKAVLGALETIKKQRPILLIAIYHNGKDFFELKPLIDELIPGYTFKIRKLCTHHLILETFLIASPKL